MDPLPRCDGHDEGEGAAQAGTGAVDPDAAAVQLDEPARERQPETAALLPAAMTRVQLLEGVEDALPVAGGDADAGVGHRDPHGRAPVPGRAMPGRGAQRDVAALQIG